MDGRADGDGRKGGWRAEAWRLLDVSARALTGDALHPFAAEENECQSVGAGAPSLLHVWRHEKALVLGLRDRKLPLAARAMERFAADGWSVAVRNSGGAAVPLDSGIVNVSMVLPNAPGAVNIHDDFAAMSKLIGDTVGLLAEGADVQAGEIAGAYCPGDYDLAIGGFKFCGIAQRRRVHAYVMQAFVIVEGSGAERARAAAGFYSAASGGAQAPQALQVSEHSSRSLQELIGGGVTVERFVHALRQAAFSGVKVIEERHDYGHYDRSQLEESIRVMKSRYDTD